MSYEVIGWVAGCLLLSSSLPQIIANLRHPNLARHQSPMRNLLQCIGNLLWLIYAMLFSITAMKVFASLGAVLAGALFIQVLRSRRA